MKYIVIPGSPTFEALAALMARVNAIEKTIKELVAELGGESYVANGSRAAAGYLSGIRFKAQPEGWKQVHKGLAYNMYFPRSIKANKELLGRIAAIPVVKRSEFNDIVGFKTQCVGTRFIQGIGVVVGQDFSLIEISEEAEYTPLADMEEITVSEYKRMEAKLKTAREEAIIE